MWYTTNVKAYAKANRPIASIIAIDQELSSLLITANVAKHGMDIRQNIIMQKP